MALDLIEPLIPDAQKNRGPDLFLQGLGQGLQAFTRMAAMRRESESEIAKMALQERLAGQEHDLKAQQLAQSYELDNRRIQVAEDMVPYQQRASEAQTDLNAEHAKAFAEGTATAAQMKQEQTKQKMALLKEVADNARSMKLDDPHFQTKNPMEFAKNVLEFGRMYHLSPLPEVKSAIKGYQAIADEQKLFIKHGVEDDTGSIKGMGQGRQVPAWRIISNVNNPQTREQTLRDLEASGYTELVQGFTSMTDKEGKRVDVPTKTRSLKGPIKKMLDESLTLDGTADAAPEAAAAPAPMPDYGPEPNKPQYPVGARGRRGDKWYVMTENGWQAE
jgi:hypothetical protein